MSRQRTMEMLALQTADEEFSDSAGSSHEPADYCSRRGAAALKEQIEAYWAARGHHVMVALHNVGFHPAIRAARYDLRSDMVNGMPRPPGAPKAPPVQEVFLEDFDDGDIAFE